MSKDLFTITRVGAMQTRAVSMEEPCVELSVETMSVCDL